MEEILLNAQEFIDSADDNLKKGRYNAAIADYFKTIVTYEDFIIYKNLKILPKNHNERFDLLKKNFPELHSKTINFFKMYRESYNTRLSKSDAQTLQKYAHEIKNIADKK